MGESQTLINTTSKILLCGITLSLIGVFWLYNLGNPASLNPRAWYNQDLYTKGLIHYESMDSGMKSSCWNNVGKKYLQLVCPIMGPKSDLEVELAFYLTSCFCESIGRVPLYCKLKGASYGISLSKCAIGKCYNRFGQDSFHIIYTRMTALCHYYLQESATNSKMTRRLGKYELEELVYQAEGAGTGRPILKNMKKIVTDLIKKTSSEYTSSFKFYMDNFWMAMEDFGYNLGLIKYE